MSNLELQELLAEIDNAIAHSTAEESEDRLKASGFLDQDGEISETYSEIKAAA